MPLTIIPEDGTGRSDANSMVTVAEVNEYALTLLTTAGAGWTAEGDDERKKAAVISASRQLTYSFDWVGTKKNADQAMAFPRCDVVIDGQEVPDDEVPQQVKDATSQLAIQLLAGSGQAGTTEQEGNVSKVNVGQGAVELEFHEKLSSKTISEDVSHMLNGWGSASSINSSKSFKIVKATR